MFGRPVAELCLITNEILNFIYERCGHRLTEWDQQLLNPKKLQIYADAIVLVLLTARLDLYADLQSTSVWSIMAINGFIQ